MSVPSTTTVSGEHKEITVDTTNTPQTGDATDTKGGNERLFTQADLDAKVKDRLDREARKQAEALDRAKREAEEEALKKNAEWQALAEKHAKRISELETVQQAVEEKDAELQRYRGALESHLKGQRDSLPSHITDLLDRLDPVDQLEWLAKNRESLSTRPGNGIPATPRPSGQVTNEQIIEQQTERLRKTGRYNL